MFYRFGPDKPGNWSIREIASDHTMTAVEPVYTYWRAQLANVCWQDHLQQTNRGRLYEGIIQAVGATVSAKVKETVNEKYPFKLIEVAGDGRCGWRAITCSSHPEEFQRIARTT